MFPMIDYYNLNKIFTNLNILMASRPGLTGSKSALGSNQIDRPMVGRNSLFKEVGKTNLKNNSINNGFMNKSPMPANKG